MSFIGSRAAILRTGFDPTFARWRLAVINDGGRFTSLTDYQFNLCIERLRSTGLLSGLDFLKFYVGDDAGNVPHAAKFDLINLRAGTMHSTPTLTPGKGITGDGASSYEDTGWNPATMGVKYTQNLASIFGYFQTPDSRTGTVNSAAIGKSGTPGNSNFGKTTTTTFSYGINASASDASISATVGVTAPGFFYLERSSSSNVNYGFGGGTLTSAASTSGAVSSNNWYVGACNNGSNVAGSFTNATLGVVGAGTAFGQAGSTMLYNILYIMLHGISPVNFP